MASGIDPAAPGPGRDGAPGRGTARTFRRSLAARIFSLLTALNLCAATATRLAAREPAAGLFVLGLLALLAFAGVASAWGDRVTLDAEGVTISNPALAWIGLKGRSLAWADVASVREHRRPRPAGGEEPVRAVILVPRSGRRVVLDSLQDFDEARRIVAQRTMRS